MMMMMMMMMIRTIVVTVMTNITVGRYSRDETILSNPNCFLGSSYHHLHFSFFGCFLALPILLLLSSSSSSSFSSFSDPSLHLSNTFVVILARRRLPSFLPRGNSNRSAVHVGWIQFGSQIHGLTRSRGRVASGNGRPRDLVHVRQIRKHRHVRIERRGCGGRMGPREVRSRDGFAFGNGEILIIITTILDLIHFLSNPDP
mmetsp:Transcript_981/g.1399  ORF Transcript_981/g.1399 Transcript_981/m.1399 type:complete len:201 (+) Transcript_981:1-603(+)